MSGNKIGLGVRVVRGPDWKWGDQDGGEGCTGTVVLIFGPEASAVTPKSPEKTVMVQWDFGSRTNYRIGHQDAFDLRVIDNAQIGVRHSFRCCSCRVSDDQDSLGNLNNSSNSSQNDDVIGMLWVCTKCRDTNLCTSCYMSDHHDVGHIFRRVDSSNEALGTLLPPRLGSRRIPLKGLFPGAQVKRGHDWAWDDQDGGPGNIGKIISVQGWDWESQRSVASVIWSNCSSANIYRLGHRGKVDLECVTAASPGHYYPDHLPVLGTSGVCRKPTSPDVSVPILLELPESIQSFNIQLQPQEQRLPQRPPQQRQPRQQQQAQQQRQPQQPQQIPAAETKRTFILGERVRVREGIGVEELRQLQESHGGYNARMAGILDQVGLVHRITNTGDVRVQFPGTPEAVFRWTINPKALVKVKVGGSNAASSSSANNSSKGKSDSDELLNQLSQELSKPRLDQVVSDASSGKADAISNWIVSMPPHIWQSTTRAMKALRFGMHAATRKGHVNVLKVILQHFPDLINQRTEGRTPLHMAAAHGQVETVKFLISQGADVNLPTINEGNNENSVSGETPHILAAYGRHLATIEVLLQHQADVDASNSQGCTALHVAATISDGETVSLLLSHPNINVNHQDHHGNTPLHEAISQCGIGAANMTPVAASIITNLCLHPAVDFGVINQRGFNSFQYAALKGNPLAARLILSHGPANLIQVAKEDGFNPLLLAALNGHVEVVRLLIDHGGGASLLLESADLQGQTALHSAVHQGQAAVVELILSELDSSALKSYINKVDLAGETALHVALSREGDPPIPLSPAAAPIIARLAVKAENFGVPRQLVHAISIATFLILRGGKLTIKNSSGHTPLEHVFDLQAKAFLLDTVSQFQMAKQSHLRAAKPVTPPAFIAGAASALPVTASSSGSSTSSRSPSECRICCENRAQVTFRPCGHQIVCQDCSSRMKKCLACNVRIESRSPDTHVDPVVQQGYVNVLEAKVQDLEDRYTCSICMGRTKRIVFLCGHGACDECAKTLNTCHMCRKPITQKIVIY